MPAVCGPAQACPTGPETPAGGQCQLPALRGRRRCRLHGGLSPGAPRGAQNGNYKDASWTGKAFEERRWLRSLTRAFAQRSTNGA
ncbi:MAG: HGGxSTG domain-containing protein [Xanthobacteraceae bacterium]